MPIAEARITFNGLRVGLRLLWAMLLLCLPISAKADGGATVTLANNDLFRGRSVSQGRPVATAQLAYDSLSGFYLGGAVTGVLTRDAGTQLLDTQAYAGYAYKIASGPTLDGSVVNTRYTRWYSGSRTVDYTEFSLGLLTRNISSHLRFSPDYIGSGVASVYGDVDGVLRMAHNWQLSGHVGVLTQASGPTPVHGHRQRVDWRIDLSRDIGHVNLQVGWAGAAPGTDYYADQPRGRSAFLVSTAYVF